MDQKSAVVPIPTFVGFLKSKMAAKIAIAT